MKHRTCRVCGEDKPLNSEHFRPQHKREGKYRTECIDCQKALNNERSKAKGWYYNYTPIKRYKSWLRDIKKRYEITEDRVISMMDKARGCCDICKESLVNPEDKNTYHIDHNHTSGKVRGLLCHKCNTGIGLLGENKATLLSAIRYLDNEKIN